MLRTPKSLWILVVLLSLFTVNAFGYGDDDEYDDYIPEDNARVARIKFLDGEAQIKRVDNEEWEVATANLPLVEGDEITTSKDTRIELQFDKNTYLRLDANSYLKIVNLQDKGIAVSLSQGTMNLTILKYDKDESYFEIDAPKTTIAIQKEGTYRIDAGDENNKEVRVVVSKSGQARVYSDDSGFVLKNGRSARLFLEGSYAGEWETSRNSNYGDDFDRWTAERNELVERNLRNAQYNKYYDDDIYGADDLNDNGSWVYSRDYGYVWKPYNRSTSRYRNWSPYRYGQWRWLPSYGWSWVNDEPWGWATYHYGRWIHTGGYWAWSPYSGYRRTRSYWRPAIVYITFIGDSYCWYPLPYNYGYYDYNRDYRRRWRRDRRARRDRRTTRTTRPVPAANIARARRLRTPPHRRVPRNGVVSIHKDAFGSGRKSTQIPTITVADTVLKRKPVIVDSPPLIPTYKDVSKNVGKDILVKDDRRTVTKREVKIGAGDRKVGSSLDETLRRKTIYGNRTPQTINRRNDTKRDGTSVETKSRGTGVFDRTKRRDTQSPDIINTPTRTPTKRSTTTTTKTPTKRTETRRTTPTTRRTTPDSIPSSRPQPRRTAPTRRTPPPRRTETKPSSPPPRRSSPPPKRSKPAPAKSSKPAPKKESKPKPSRSKTKSEKIS